VLGDLLDNRPEVAVPFLDVALALSQEPVEIVEQHPIEDGPLRMTRAIDSRHIGNKVSRNASRVENHEPPNIPKQKAFSKRPLPQTDNKD